MVEGLWGLTGDPVAWGDVGEIWAEWEMVSVGLAEVSEAEGAGSG